MSPDERSAAYDNQAQASDRSGRPTWAEIDLGALLHNYYMLCGLLRTSGAEEASARHPRSSAVPRLIPVIKADAYGHGAVPVARALADAGATAFAVALVEEGRALRAAKISQDILVLEGAWPGEEEELLKHRVTATVYSPDGVRRLDEAAKRRGSVVCVQIKIDTGMARLGVPWDNMSPFLGALQDAPRLCLTGTFTHLASAEEEDGAYTAEQLRRFDHAVGQIRRGGFDPGEIHVANSAGLLYGPPLQAMSARPGIALYGYPPAPGRCTLPFRPVLTLKTRIGRIHVIPAGESVGYNRRFIASRATRTATLPIGYADGYRRDLTGRGHVLIRGREALVIGAVSMDMIVVDVTDLPEVQEGEEAILLGSDGQHRFDAADWAELVGTIPYEILCGIGSRIPRIYLSP